MLQTFVPFPEEGDDKTSDIFKNSGKRVFENEDFQLLYALPESTEFIDRISDITDAFLMVDPAKIKKNLKEIKSDN